MAMGSVFIINLLAFYYYNARRNILSENKMLLPLSTIYSHTGLKIKQWKTKEKQKQTKKKEA